jgi:hypothetical protein
MTLSNNNLRYIDPDRRSSGVAVSESLASENQSHRARGFLTPEQEPKILLGKSSTKHKKQERYRVKSKQKKERMFNNDYLNCYFKIH